MNDHLFGKELFILFAASAFCKLSSIYVFSYFPFGFEGRIWDLIVSVPDHCLSFYFPEDMFSHGVVHISYVSYAYSVYFEFLSYHFTWDIFAVYGKEYHWPVANEFQDFVMLK